LKIIFLGDVVGRPGRRAVRLVLPRLMEEHSADFAIVNCENAAAGYGITRSTADELFAGGADCLTSGNHIWANKEAETLLAQDPRILRPANFASGAPGQGVGVYQARNGETIGVINLIGRIFMDPADCPFRRGSEELAAIQTECEAVVIDFHAEATSEKQALGYYFDGRVSAVIGTHTHVMTCDESILPAGTAFITDCGMTGPTDSIIGVEREAVLHKFLTGMPVRFEVPKHAEALISGVIIETALDKKGAKNIQRISLHVPSA